VGLDLPDEVREEPGFLVGEALLVGGYSGRREARALDHLPDAAVVDGFRDLLGGVDLVGEPADLLGAKRVVGALGGATPLLAQPLDVLRDIPVKRVREGL